MRPLTRRMAKAIRDGTPLALLAEIETSDGVGRFWTGVGRLHYRGEWWTGAGVLAGIAPVRSSTDLAIYEISFSVSGLPQETVQFMEFEVRGRPAKAWLAAITRNMRVVPDPLQVVDAVLDNRRVSMDEGGTVSLTLFARAGFYTLERSIDEVHSPEDQRRRFPGDSGCDLITDLQDQDIIWTPA